MSISRNLMQFVIGLGVGLVIIVTALNVPRLWFQYRSDEVQQQLLYHSDHAALLAECRLFMRQHPPPGGETYLSGVDPCLPIRLRQLKANYVRMTSEEMHFTCGGGLTYEYYITAFALGSNEEGQVRIISGLWYRRGTSNDH